MNGWIGNVFPEDRPGIRVRLFNRRAGKTDERRVGKCVPDILGEAVADLAGLLVEPGRKSVLRAVRLVGDNDDVLPLAQQRMFRPFVLRKESLNGGKHHAATGDLEQLTQMLTVLRLHRLLSRQFVAARERPKELVVQIVAVTEHNEGGILHGRFKDEPSRVERHSQRFARTLRVPHHAHALVPHLATGHPADEVTSATVML